MDKVFKVGDKVVYKSPELDDRFAYGWAGVITEIEGLLNRVYVRWDNGSNRKTCPYVKNLFPCYISEKELIEDYCID